MVCVSLIELRGLKRHAGEEEQSLRVTLPTLLFRCPS
jgi:hypothetical protein